jgi:hypothetical protein
MMYGENNEVYWTLTEISDATNVPPATLLMAAKFGTLKGLAVDGAIFVEEKKLLRYLAAYQYEMTNQITIPKG